MNRTKPRNSDAGNPRGKADPSEPQITLRFTRRVGESNHAAHHFRSFLNGIRTTDQQMKLERKWRANRVYTKGAIRSKRGLYDEDALVTATKAHLILDAGARPFGGGEFVPGHGLSKGRFVPDPGVGGHVPEKYLDNAPIAMGDMFVRHGKGTPVGRPGGMKVDHDYKPL